MLQLQYITKLKNKHINNILDNYKLKYSGMKNEIDTKVNELIKLFLKDILSFLENLEQAATNKKKLNNYDKMKTELESIRNQLKIKAYNERKVKNELDLLTQENSLLKVKIKSLNQKILNLNNNLSNSNNNLYYIRNKSPFWCRNSVKNKSFMTPRIDIKGKLHNTSGVILYYAKKKTSSVDNAKMRTENDKDKDNYNLDFSSVNIKNSLTIKNKRKPNLNIRRKSLVNNNRKDRINIKLSLKKEKKNNNNDNINPINQKKKKINFNKFVNNPATNNTNNANNITKNNEVPSSPGPILSAISKIMINDKKERSSSSKSNKSNPKELRSSNYSPNNSFELLYKTNKDYEEIGKNINSVLDDELKQLEIDEENINKLLNQINCEDFDDIIMKKNTNDSNFSLKDE